MDFNLSGDLYKSRADTSEYHVNIVKTVPRTRRIVLYDWEFPDIIHNGAPVTQLAVVINSNMGVVGQSGPERSNILSGSGVKQIIFNKTDNGWKPINDINSIDYVSESAAFSFKLRMSTSMGIVNVPLALKVSWKLKVRIV